MIQDVLNRLARLVDQPWIPWKNVVVGFSLGIFGLENWLLWRQYAVYTRTIRPKTLEKEVDQKTFDKSQAYGRAKAKFNFISSIFGQAVKLFIIYADMWPKAWALVGSFMASYAPARFSGEITHSLLFFFLFGLIDTIIELPLSYYHNFVLEEEFGFNKMTVGLWLMDKVKGQLLTVALGTPIGAGILAIIKKTGEGFFYYLWLFTLFVSLVGVTIYPIVIVPLFNKLEPLKEGTLKAGIDALASKLKFPLGELQVIDGSKRSSHSNAYFTGLPWKKKIVIYDTLLEQSSEKEVEAVLAHELGHWSMSHTTKLLAISQFHVFYIFALFSSFVRNKSLYDAFGFTREQPVLIGFMLFNEVFGASDSVVKLLMNVMTRKFEFQADKFALDLGYKTELAAALIKLQIKNLSSMDADYFYSAYHHSHPILTERLKALNYKGESKVEYKNQDSEKATKAADREL
ncbi:CaaX prenyl protease [Venturia nashicola]|uniref:CAAX prenyl protease n=1 Tax=Venturia nashicola TaxID=86259 RepID=A0A4Z1PV35_9PEZI|nr:CaaX prenyl protease [Venturia nashicola]TLD39055.1 CaaX prenyl protease [Venturia nashicola]